MERRATPGPTPTDSPRRAILGRIREALQGREPGEHPGRFPGGLETGAAAGPATRPGAASAEATRPGDALGGASAIRPAAAFADAFRRAGGEAVILQGESAAREWLDDFAAGFAVVAVGEGLPAAWRPDLPDALPEDAMLGVGRAVAAAADTGTLLLDSRGGRRSQLLPPVHLVWVDAADVHATLDGAMRSVADAGLPPVIALHSGPSKSADIGRIVVTGVHGPGRVVAAIVE